MNALKNHSSSSNHQEKVIHQVKSSSIKDEDSNLFGMTIKNSKSKINSFDSNLKCHNKTSEVKCLQNVNLKPCITQASVTNFDKRNNEKSDATTQKKSKTEIATYQKSEITEDFILAKKISKFKSIYPKTYICKFCCRRFYSEEYLQQHTKSHGNKTSHICYLCNHQTASFSALMTHYLKHSGTKGNKLDKIYAKSKADYTNIQFNISSRPKPSFRCSQCKLSFNTKLKFDSHNCSTVLEKNVYNCAYCGRASSTIEEYRNCVQSHSETPFICSYCKCKFQRKKQLDKHLEQCKPQSKVLEDYKCDKCVMFICKSKNELDEHLKSCGKSPSYTCANCGSKFEEKKIYKNHLLVCKPLKKENLRKVGRPKKPLELLKKKKFPCSLCGHIFNLKKECKEHEKYCLVVTTNTTNETNFDECSTCGSIIEISKLFEHINTCSEKQNLDIQKKSENTLDEKVCLDPDDLNQKNSKSFNDIADLKVIDSHIKKNSLNIDNKISSDQNQPNILKKSSVDDSHGTRRSARLVRRKSSFSEDNEIVKKKRKSLKIKIPKHPKILGKPKFRKGKESKNGIFLCNICDFSFCSKSTLLRHKRMHSGNPWYICQYCGKFFFRKDVYIRHEGNVHSKETKVIFRCCYCKHSFNDSSLLKDHVLAEHKDSAFLPVRPRFSGKKCYSTSSGKIKIKQEFDDAKMDDDKSDLKNIKEKGNNDLNESLSPSSTPSCKSGIFSQSLVEETSNTAIHMDILSNNLQNKIVNEFPSNSEKEEIEHLYNLKESISSSSKISDNEPFCELTVSVLHLPNSTENNLNKPNNLLNDNTNSALDEVMPNTNLLTSDNSKPLICMMCFKKFSNKSLFEAHNKTMHKIVDWYQCVVCSANGPKQDMQEHMFSHMFKVGTFVVNSNRKNFDAIIPCVQLGNQEKVRDKNTYLSKEKPQTETQNSFSSEMTDLVCDEDLPPLREFGICPCIDSKCNQDKMPNLQIETGLDYEHNSSANIVKDQFPDNFNSCMNNTDKINNESKYSTECETSVIKYSTSTLVKTNDELDEIDAELKYSSEIKTSITKSCTDDYIVIGTDTFMKSNEALEEREAKLKYSSKCENVTKCCTDNVTIVKSADTCMESNDALEGEKTKLKYSTEYKTCVSENCINNNSIIVNADNCMKSNDSLEEKEGKQKHSSGCKTSTTKSCIKNNSIVVSTDVCMKSNDALEEKREKMKYFSECEPNATLSCANSNFIENSDDCIKSPDTFEEKEVKSVELHLSESLFSSQSKEQSLSLQADGCISQSCQNDYETGSFSQLRYLLQKPSKIKSENYENKITIYPSSHPETTGFIQESSNPFIKCVSNIEEYNDLFRNPQNQNLDEANLLSKSQSNFDLQKQNFNTFNNINFTVQTSLDNSQSTCLKLDVNQSRSQFSENQITSTLNPKIQNCVYDKADNLFKPCPSQSTILDFSDLIQHSFENSSPCEDNIFSYSAPMKQVDFLSDVSSQEEVHTPDCTNMVNYDCSAFNNSVKCEDCNEVFVDNNEYTNHVCVSAKPLKLAELNFLYKPKNTFERVHCVENQNKVPCVTSTSEEKLNILSPHKSTETFVHAKVMTSETDLERYKSEPLLNAQSAPQNSKCPRCHTTFRDIGELMKHSLSCLKSLFLKTSPTNDSVTPIGALDSLLLKDEPSTSFSDFSLNSPGLVDIVSTEHSHLNSEESIKHSFDS